MQFKQSIIFIILLRSRKNCEPFSRNVIIVLFNLRENALECKKFIKGNVEIGVILASIDKFNLGFEMIEVIKLRFRFYAGIFFQLNYL